MPLAVSVYFLGFMRTALPISPHPRLSTSTHITIVRQIVTFSTSDDASVVGESLQRQRSFSLELTVMYNITVDLPSFSTLLSVMSGVSRHGT